MTNLTARLADLTEETKGRVFSRWGNSLIQIASPASLLPFRLGLGWDVDKRGPGTRENCRFALTPTPEMPFYSNHDRKGPLMCFAEENVRLALPACQLVVARFLHCLQKQALQTPTQVAEDTLFSACNPT